MCLVILQFYKISLTMLTMTEQNNAGKEVALENIITSAV